MVTFFSVLSALLHGEQFRTRQVLSSISFSKFAYHYVHWLGLSSFHIGSRMWSGTFSMAVWQREQNQRRIYKLISFVHRVWWNTTTRVLSSPLSPPWRHLQGGSSACIQGIPGSCSLSNETTTKKGGDKLNQLLYLQYLNKSKYCNNKTHSHSASLPQCTGSASSSHTGPCAFWRCVQTSGVWACLCPWEVHICRGKVWLKWWH